MYMTNYGRKIAQAEMPLPNFGTGATGHMAATQHKVKGHSMILTGKDNKGKRFTLTAESMVGAWMKARAAYGVANVWHVDENGKRRKVAYR